MDDKEIVLTELKKEVLTSKIESGAKFLVKKVLTYNASDKDEAERLISKTEENSDGLVTYNLKYKKETKKREAYYEVDITETFNIE